MENLIQLRRKKSLIEEYAESFSGKAEKTVDAYVRVVRQLTDWIADRPGSAGVFRPEQFTKTAMEIYLSELHNAGYSGSHLIKVKAAASSFANWLIEKEMMDRNPTRRIPIPVEASMAPRELDSDQRYVLRNIFERHCDLRGKAIFALGYWAALPVSDISWLRIEDVHIGPKIGWIRAGYKGNKYREIVLTKFVGH